MAVTNEQVARTLERIAEILELQGQNPFRVHAYRRAAGVVRAQAQPVEGLVRDNGEEALHEQGVGRAIGALLVEVVETGRLRLLERLERELPVEARLQRLPGLGPKLAKKVCEALHVETLEDLEVAAHDGALEKVPGFGARRAEQVREELAALLGRRTRGAPARAAEAAHLPPVPPVAVLLEVDLQYRAKAAAGELPRIAPRRFNPSHEAWLPVLHTRRDGLDFTALFSNTARAHQLGTTRDWVVLYWGHEHRENQCTVVTETRGALQGRRVVRGHEAECRTHYGAGTHAAHA